MKEVIKENYALYNGDCVEVMKQLPDGFADMSVYSPPFASMYTYSSDERDLGNCKDYDEFLEHYSFVIKEIERITKPGRMTAVHCMDIPRNGDQGISDFPGDIIRLHEKLGFKFWEEKIQFNNLNNYNADLLNKSSFMLGELEKYLNLKTTLADDLQRQLTQIYIDIRTEWKDVKAENNNIFWEIVNRCTPKKGSAYQNAVLTIMAKYFESCDIFEEPK